MNIHEMMIKLLVKPSKAQLRRVVKEAEAHGLDIWAELDVIISKIDGRDDVWSLYEDLWFAHSKK